MRLFLLIVIFGQIDKIIMLNKHQGFMKQLFLFLFFLFSCRLNSEPTRIDPKTIISSFSSDQSSNSTLKDVLTKIRTCICGDVLLNYRAGFEFTNYIKIGKSIYQVNLKKLKDGADYSSCIYIFDDLKENPFELLSDDVQAVVSSKTNLATGCFNKEPIELLVFYLGEFYFFNLNTKATSSCSTSVKSLNNEEKRISNGFVPVSRLFSQYYLEPYGGFALGRQATERRLNAGCFDKSFFNHLIGKKIDFADQCYQIVNFAGTTVWESELDELFPGQQVCGAFIEEAFLRSGRVIISGCISRWLFLRTRLVIDNGVLSSESYYYNVGLNSIYNHQEYCDYVKACKAEGLKGLYNKINYFYPENDNIGFDKDVVKNEPERYENKKGKTLLAGSLCATIVATGFGAKKFYYKNKKTAGSGRFSKYFGAPDKVNKRPKKI